jgi:hypothetical protein
MNLIFFLKIGFAEIPYINKGLLVYLVFSMGMGGKNFEKKNFDFLKSYEIC